MGKFARELEKVNSEISIIKEKLDEKNKIPRTRKANVVTVKTLSEIFPEMKTLETMWILGEINYDFKFTINDNTWRSEFSGREVEILDENESEYSLDFKIYQASLKKEWTFNKREKTFKVKVDISPETIKLEKLYIRVKELKEEVKKEKLEEQKELEESKEWCKKIDMMKVWITENIEDDEKTNYWKQFLEQEKYIKFYEMGKEWKKL